MKNQGFTLIEMLIVIGVSAFLITSVAGWTITTLKTTNKVKATAEVEQNGEWIMAQIRELLFAADASSLNCSAGGATSITFTSVFDGGATTLSCNTAAVPASGTYFIASSSATLAPVATTLFNMVPRSLTVTNCGTFVSCTNDTYPKVTVSFRLQSGSSSGFWDTYVYKDFSESFVIRD